MHPGISPGCFPARKRAGTGNNGTKGKNEGITKKHTNQARKIGQARKRVWPFLFIWRRNSFRNFRRVGIVVPETGLKIPFYLVRPD